MVLIMSERASHVVTVSLFGLLFAAPGDLAEAAEAAEAAAAPGFEVAMRPCLEKMLKQAATCTAL